MYITLPRKGPNMDKTHRDDLLAIKRELRKGVDTLFGGDTHSMGHRICTLWVNDVDNYRPIIDKYVQRGFPVDQIGLILLQDYLYKIHSVLDAADPTDLNTDCDKNRTEHGETFGVVSLEALRPGETVKLLDGYCYSLQELREFGEHGTRISPATRRSFTNDERVLFQILTQLPMTQLSTTYRSLAAGGGKTRRRTQRKMTKKCLKQNRCSKKKKPTKSTRRRRRVYKNIGGNQETIAPGEQAALAWTMDKHKEFMERAYGNHPQAQAHIQEHLSKEQTELSKYYQ